MILHIFSDSPYTEKFIRFINKYFDSKEHLFIVLSLKKDSKFLDFYKTQSNCKVTNNKSMYFKYAKEFKNSEQIIIHQLNKPILMLSLLLFYPKAYKKMLWSIWGGDVYFYKYKTNSLKDNILELLRKIVIYRIPVITSYIKEDFNNVVNVYKSNATYIKAKYPSPIEEDKILELATIKNDVDCTLNILVGNSADPSNEHIKVFNMLKKFKNEDIKVIPVLSYGGSKEYIEQISTLGKTIFGNKFKPILKYMDMDEYLNFLNTIDISVFNHKIQQGLGNVYVLLALKKKVYLDSDISSFKYYDELGINIYDTKKIEDLSFENFQSNNEKVVLENYKLILNDISEKTIYKEWEIVFNQSLPKGTK